MYGQTLTSQPQPQENEPTPQPQTYETSQQYQIPQPQFQPYQQPETPLPQPNQSSQSQTYQQSQPQTYQQSQPQLYQPPQTQYQTPGFNPPVTNNIYQGEPIQSSNYVMSPNSNALEDNYKQFQDDLNTPNKNRLNCQMVIAVLLLLSLVFDFPYFYLSSLWSLIKIIESIMNLIIGIWMIILTKNKQTTRNCCLAAISLISLIICITIFIIYLLKGFISGSDIIEIILLIIATSYNCKCK